MTCHQSFNGNFPLCDFRTPDGSLDFFLIAIPQFGNIRFMLLF